jgi:hypothetical protein
MYVVLAGPKDNRRFYGDGPDVETRNSPTFRKLADRSSVYCHVNKHYLKKNYPLPSGMDQIVKVWQLPQNRDDLSVIIPDYEYYDVGGATYRVDRAKQTIECRYTRVASGWFTSCHSWETWKNVKKRRISRLIVENAR